MNLYKLWDLYERYSAPSNYRPYDKYTFMVIILMGSLTVSTMPIAYYNKRITIYDLIVFILLGGAAIILGSIRLRQRLKFDKNLIQRYRNELH